MDLNRIIDVNDQKNLNVKMSETPHLAKLLSAIERANGKGILVGGSVRDHLLGLPAFDLDVEVYGLSQGELEKVLNESFQVILVGKSFGVYKVTIDSDGKKQTIDVSLPRREQKTGLGHRNFTVQCDQNLTFKEASLRRDFTINAMGIALPENILLDPHNGQTDLKNGVLRHVSLAFLEDPLRVLRGAQFCARFGLTMAKDTIALCKTLRPELDTLSQERIYGEMRKLLLAKKPSIGFKVLDETSALTLFPELLALQGLEQDSIWHPEGDVWIHSLMVTDEAAALAHASPLTEEERLIVVTGALCHDLGKPYTTIHVDGRVKSPGHEQKGEEPTVSFLTRAGFHQKFIDEVVPLVKEHLKPHQLYSKRDEISDAAIKRLAFRVNISLLLYVSEADFLGRTSPEALSRHDPSASWLRAKAHALSVENQPEPALMQGRHLIALSEKPGPKFKVLLEKAYEAQLEGQFATEDEGIVWLKKHLGGNNHES